MQRGPCDLWLLDGKLVRGALQAWLCENPMKLVLGQKMRGHPLIWELPRKTLEPLVKALKVRCIYFCWDKYHTMQLLKQSMMVRA